MDEHSICLTIIEEFNSVSKLFERWGNENLAFIIQLDGNSKCIKKESRIQRIGDITYSSVSILGTSFVIAGIVTAPVTAGTALGLTAAGTALISSSAAAGMAHAAASQNIRDKKTGSSNVFLRKYESVQKKIKTRSNIILRGCDSVQKWLNIKNLDSTHVERILGEIKDKNEILKGKIDFISSFFVQRLDFDIDDKVNSHDNLKMEIIVSKTQTAIQTAQKNRIVKRFLPIIGFLSPVYTCFTNAKNSFTCMKALSLLKIPGRVAEVKKVLLKSLSPTMQHYVPAALKKSVNGATVLHPAIGSTAGGVGMAVSVAAIAYNANNLHKGKPCKDETHLRDFLQEYSKSMQEFHKSLTSIADDIERRIESTLKDSDGNDFPGQQYFETCLEEFRDWKLYFSHSLPIITEVNNLPPDFKEGETFHMTSPSFKTKQ